MQLYKRTLKKAERFVVPNTHSAVWVKSGEVRQADKTWLANDGFYVAPEDEIIAGSLSEILYFSLRDKHQESNKNTLLAAEFEWPHTDCVLRLDTVTFPKGAIAYRHVHAGAGIRYLSRGSLEIRSDHHVEQFETGGAWFEDINSPVKATASDQEISQFIRALVLPMAYAGKSTINLLNPEDFDKLRLQSSRLIFDQHITF